MSATINLSFKLSHALGESLEGRWQRMGYKNRSAYLRSLVRQDMAGKVKHHSLGLSVDQMPLEDQDHFDVYLGKRGGGAKHA